MRSLPLAQPRGRPGRYTKRLLATLLGVALHLPPGPVLAAAPAPQRCPTDVDAAPPSLALTLKNAGLELRAAGSFLRAAQCFRSAVEELPDCATYADERLRWSVWAAEDLERADPGKNTDLHTFLERQVVLVESSPEGRALADLPLLIAARDRQKSSRRRAAAGTASSPVAPRARQVAVGLMAGGAPLMVAGAALTGVFEVRGDRFSDRIGALNIEGADAGCTAAARPDEPERCADLRALHDDAHDEKLIATRGLITGVTVLGVGAGLLLAGLLTQLHARPPARRGAALRLLPAGAGLVLRGQF